MQESSRLIGHLDVGQASEPENQNARLDSNLFDDRAIYIKEFLGFVRQREKAPKSKRINKNKT
jgi:hypothetical protein